MAREAIQTNVGITSTNVFGNVDTNAVCLQLGGSGALANVFSHGGGAPDDFRLRKRQEATVRLPGYGGGTGTLGPLRKWSPSSAVRTLAVAVNPAAPQRVVQAVVTPVVRCANFRHSFQHPIGRRLLLAARGDHEQAAADLVEMR